MARKIGPRGKSQTALRLSDHPIGLGKAPGLFVPYHSDLPSRQTPKHPNDLQLFFDHKHDDSNGTL